MIGYVILSKRVNADAPDGFDYAPVSTVVFTDPVEADYTRGGFAYQEDVTFVIADISGEHTI